MVPKHRVHACVRAIIIIILGEKSESGYHDSPKTFMIIIISIGLTITITILGLIATAVLMIMKIR